MLKEYQENSGKLIEDQKKKINELQIALDNVAMRNKIKLDELKATYERKIKEIDEVSFREIEVVKLESQNSLQEICEKKQNLIDSLQKGFNPE